MLDTGKIMQIIKKLNDYVQDNSIIPLLVILYNKMMKDMLITLEK